MFADCIVSVTNGAAIGRPDLTGIKAVNPLNDRQIVFVATKDGVAVSAYYVLVSDIPGTNQETGWLGSAEFYLILGVMVLMYLGINGYTIVLPMVCPALILSGRFIYASTRRELNA